MRVIAHCPKCDAGLLVSATEAPESIKCGRCGHVLALTFSESIRSDARVDVCPVCRGGDFYIRKLGKEGAKYGLTLWNKTIKTYHNVSQFWTYDEKRFLAQPVYSRDYPPLKP